MSLSRVVSFPRLLIQWLIFIVILCGVALLMAPALFSLLLDSPDDAKETSAFWRGPWNLS